MENNVILIILDGWGLSPIEEGNAILQAKTPVFDSLVTGFLHTALHASGNEVGLETGEMGNSEVGHLNLGTGRIIEQNLPRINNAIVSGVFFANDRLISACEWVKKNNSILHLVGLVSDGGIHSHIDHLFALLEMAKKQGIKKVAIQMITDGRDTPAKSAERFLIKIDEKIKKIGVGTIATVSGRYYAMDRDRHWERIKLAYNAMVLGQGQKAKSALAAVKLAYDRGESDENLVPTIIDESLNIHDNDAIVFFNYRQDRAKQISTALIDPQFNGFSRQKFVKNLLFVTFTNYGHEPTPLVKIAFFAQKIDWQLCKVISDAGICQLHTAETEKYAHVTYFFNGGMEKEFINEHRILVPSPRVTTYDKKPQMSALEVTNKLISFYNNKHPGFTVVNFANPDMVGHTGNLGATIKACETVDQCLGKIIFALKNKVTNFIILADHGNAEQLINPTTKEVDKEHTTNSVPFILTETEKFSNFKLKEFSLEEKMIFNSTSSTGVLADLAPTVIDLLELAVPEQMTGQSLKDVI